MQEGVSETTTCDCDALDRLMDFTIGGTITSVSEYTFDGCNGKTESTLRQMTGVAHQTGWVYTEKG